MKTDPIEKIIAEALDSVGVPYEREGTKGKNTELDFYLPGINVHIEVKQFYSERAIRQLEGREDVVFIQGRKAAESFSHFLSVVYSNGWDAGKEVE